MAKTHVTMKVNGAEVEGLVEPRTLLVHFIRENLMLTGTHIGCETTCGGLIVEVLSSATERYDRDGKFEAYKKLPSFEQYVLVSQDERRVEVRTLHEGTWAVQMRGRRRVGPHSRARVSGEHDLFVRTRTPAAGGQRLVLTTLAEMFA